MSKEGTEEDFNICYYGLGFQVAWKINRYYSVDLCGAPLLMQTPEQE